MTPLAAKEKTMLMRPSRVLTKLRAGEVAVSFKINLACARAAEIAAMSGFDCVWADREHIANDWTIIEQQVWATKAHDVDLMVRVSRGSYTDHVAPLELDAAGIMVPHVMSLEDAKQVVRMTRFHPIGRRPLDGGNADGAYGAIDYPEYLPQANAQRFVAVQIEDPEVVEDIEAIAALEGIDMLFFGPGDFSQGLGAPGQWDAPGIAETRHRVAEACRQAGKFAGTVGSPETFDELAAMGYRFLNVGADVLGLHEYCQRMLAGCHRG